MTIKMDDYSGTQLKNIDIKMEVVSNPYKLIKAYNNPITHESAYGEELTQTQVPAEGYRQMVFSSHTTGDILGVIPFKGLNRLLAEVHIHIMPEYWGTPVSLNIANMMHEWLKANTTYLKVMSWVSSSHERTHKYIKKLGFERIGNIPSSCLYRGEVVDTVLYYADLYDITNNRGMI